VLWSGNRSDLFASDPPLTPSGHPVTPSVGTAKLVFFLSILGLGLFAYYQGRSHEYVLTLVWWPCFILLAIFLDSMLSAWRNRRSSLLRATVFAAVAWLLTGYAWSAVADMGCMKNLIVDQLPRSDRPRAMEIHYEAKLLRDHVGDGKEVLILSPSEPALHLLIDVPSVSPCSYIEMVLRDDYTEVLRRLSDHPTAKVYIDKNVFRYHWKRVGSRHLIDALQKEFVRAAETPMGLIFERGDLCLKSDSSPLCHTAFKEGVFPNAMEFAPIRIDREFAIELIVKPDHVNQPWRVILSNHCGSPQHQGMMIFESHPNLYELVCGTGAEWRHAAKFHLPPGVWSYLAISVGADRVRVFRDGELVDEQPIDGWQLMNGQTPLVLGDWWNHDCPFHGRIREMRILNRALSDTEIMENCGRFRSLRTY
jgi:hypothetical protein